MYFFNYFFAWTPRYASAGNYLDKFKDNVLPGHFAAGVCSKDEIRAPFQNNDNSNNNNDNNNKNKEADITKINNNINTNNNNNRW